MKQFFLINIFTLFTFSIFSQFQVKWDITTEKINEENVTLIFEAKIDKGWHLYSQFLGEKEGPIPTTFIYKENPNITIVGEAKEIGVKTHFDKVWEFDVSYFDEQARFEQKIHLSNPKESILEGEIEFMICNESECMPPTIFPFKIDLLQESAIAEEVIYEADKIENEVIPDTPNVNLDSPVDNCGNQVTEKQTYWMLFFFGLIFGLLSLFTPCVFPMIPLTVSFFTKGGSEKGKGVGKAILYGISIVAVYVSLSLPFYLPGTNPELLNEISTSFLLNIIFFAIFIVFAISFFGYFEINLPSSWVNKADKAADRGGFLGTVFMAIVLAIVSFSCTGPLLGAVLGESLSEGPIPISVAMLGFGLGLGLPFTVFALFPSLLKSLPQSGGWLNTVKVVLGFIELAFALKFLSNAEYVYQAEFLLRETFFLVWIIIALAAFVYLIGGFRFPHDTKGVKISTTRKLIAIPFLLFAIYLTPGVMPEDQQWWKTTLVSGFPPATNYSWYNQGEHHFLDYEEAMAFAKENNKPVLIDFTGYACVNCRKMEENVWTDEKVKKLLSKYVIVSLYVDNKNELPKNEQGVIEITQYDGSTYNKQIKTVGNKWATFETLRFGQVSQPYYALLSPEGYLLNNPVGYTPVVSEYTAWLECGLVANEKLNNGLKVEAKDENVVVVAEVLEPVSWEFSANKIGEDEFELLLKGNLGDNWHAYSQYLESMDGPLPTLIEFEPNEQIELIDSTLEENTETHFDTTFDMELTSFSKEAIFKQKIKVKSGNVIVKGNINYMVCTDGKCLPPTDRPFEIELK